MFYSLATNGSGLLASAETVQPAATPVSKTQMMHEATIHYCQKIHTIHTIGLRR